MNFLCTIVFLFAIVISNAQNLHQAVILDIESQEPLEFVNIFNKEDSTISNADGQFRFSSAQDSVFFYRVGYDRISTTFNALGDSIFMNKSVLELNEVVVTNKKSIWQKFKDSVKTNYKIEPYKERFFLRCVLRRNDTIVRIQDMVGKLKRKTLFYPAPLEMDKKDYEVELTNMRKVGVAVDENSLYFTFPSFYETFTEFVRINATGEGFDLEEFQLENEDKTRLNFQTAAPEKIWKTKGHYIVNNSDNAILAFERYMSSKDATFKKNKFVRYRTLKSDQQIFFTKDASAEKYYLKSAKNFALVEAIDKDNRFESIFTIEILMTTFDNFGDFEVKSNINEHKDMFKLKHPYDEGFWNSQNQLLLTEEMHAFIKKMGEENKEFKVRSNLD